jgi:phosphatidylglycerol lysyltransferase
MHLGELKLVSDGWLQKQKANEKGFSLGFFSEAYLTQMPCAVVRQDGRIVAFANLLEGADKQELSVDLMRHVGENLHGVMDFLFAELMLWGAAQGYRRFNLGMAPLSGLESHPLAPLWHRAASMIFRHGEAFYNFEGLRQYKEKFHPDWRPRYLASPGGFSLPSVLLDVAALVSGGLKEIVSK